MAFFGLFGNKEKKNREINNSNKKQILTLIQGLQMSCRNAEAITVLRNIQTELQSQGETSSEQVIALDGEVQQLLAEANTFILKQQYPTAITKLKKALNKVIDRHQYCVAGGQMTKQDKAAADRAASMFAHISSNAQKSRAEELQSQIDEKNAELDALRKEYEDLKKLHEQNPNNASINAQATTVITKIKALTTAINNLSIELSKETVDTSLSEMASANEELVKGRTFSEEQMEINRAKVVSQNEQFKETQSQVASGMDLLGVSAGGAFDPFAEGNQSAAFDPFASGDPFADGNKSKQSAQYGGFDAAAVGSAEMAGDIRKATQAIENSIDLYTDKIDDANDDLEDFNSQLRPLLERRKTASPSDCLVLDGQIDQINARRNGVIYKIKRYRQTVAQLNDKLSLLEKLSTQQDVQSTNAKIEQLTGGKFTDFEGLAMYLNEAVKESNEQLEEIGTAVSVAESEEIMMNSASGASAALSDAATVKDEHKYDALEQELTATRRA